MVERPVSEEELKKAKDSLANSLPGAFETSANAVGNFSNVFIYDLGLDYYSRYAEQVNAVTPDQTLAVGEEVPRSRAAWSSWPSATRPRSSRSCKKLNLGAIEIRDTEGRPAK